MGGEAKILEGKKKNRFGPGCRDSWRDARKKIEKGNALYYIVYKVLEGMGMMVGWMMGEKDG